MFPFSVMNKMLVSKIWKSLQCIPTSDDSTSRCACEYLQGLYLHLYLHLPNTKKDQETLLPADPIILTSVMKTCKGPSNTKENLQGPLSEGWCNGSKHTMTVLTLIL